MTTLPTAPTIPSDEEAARALAAQFQARGVLAFVHWDRSPWGVRIPLTEATDEYSPSLYVLTENTPVSDELGGRRWFGQLGNFPDQLQDDLYDTTFEWLERSFHGDSVDVIARAVAALLPLVRVTAVSA